MYSDTVCTDSHVGYTILSALMLFIGSAIGFSVPLERFYALDNAYAQLEREKEELRAEIQKLKFGAELSMRILRNIHSATENTDSSDTDV